MELKFSKDLISGFSHVGDFLWLLGKHAFLLLLFFVLIFSIWGAFLFYTYAYLPQVQKPEINTAAYQFNEVAYQKVLLEWQARDQKLSESLKEEYASPF